MRRGRVAHSLESGLETSRERNLELVVKTGEEGVSCDCFTIKQREGLLVESSACVDVQVRGAPA